MSITGVSQTSGNFSQKGIDPNSYAQQYADQNGISLEEAKVELESKYGAPDQNGTNISNDESIFNAVNNSSSASAVSSEEDAPKLGTGAFQMDESKSPDENAQSYADANGCTLDEAKTILSSIYGDPQTHEGAFEFDKTKTPEENAQLYADTYGMDAETAQEILTSVLGEMEQDETGVNPQQQALLSAGIPLEVIQEGDDAIMKFAEENDIDLSSLEKEEA